MAMELTLSGVHHIGVPVKNLQRTLDFYRDTFGLEPEMRFEESGPEVSDVVAVPDAHLDVAFLKVGNDYIEFLEYLNPKGRDYDRKNCDVGATHICFQVADIARVYKELSAKGIEFTAPPAFTPVGPLTGWTFAYFYDPDGVTVELAEGPG
jgi:catechol 2,3-dioxygenase-like lactoylglutathione lyase family enzyme